MEHDEVKIDEIVKEGLSRSVFEDDDPNGFRQQWLADKLIEYGDLIRKKTLEEVRGLVPEEIGMVGGPKDIVVNYCAGHDKCREQILSAIDTLSELNK